MFQANSGYCAYSARSPRSRIYHRATSPIRRLPACQKTGSFESGKRKEGPLISEGARRCHGILFTGLTAQNAIVLPYAAPKNERAVLDRLHQKLCSGMCQRVKRERFRLLFVCRGTCSDIRTKTHRSLHTRVSGYKCLPLVRYYIPDLRFLASWSSINMSPPSPESYWWTVLGFPVVFPKSVANCGSATGMHAHLLDT